MADRPPVSVFLPTIRWTDACTELAAQLEDHDELLLSHGVEDGPVTGHQNIPEGIRLIAAGEPEHCSGKANAIVTGMEAAHHDRLIWTATIFPIPRTGWRPSAPTTKRMGRYRRCRTSLDKTRCR